MLSWSFKKLTGNVISATICYALVYHIIMKKKINRSNTFHSKTETGPIRRAERCGFRPRLDTAIYTKCIATYKTFSTFCIQFVIML